MGFSIYISGIGHFGENIEKKALPLPLPLPFYFIFFIKFQAWLANKFRSRDDEYD